MDSQNAIAFIDNHDNQRGHGAGGSQIVTFREDVLYNMVNAFELAWPYGYVRLMSSYIWPVDVQVEIHFPFVSNKQLKCKGRFKIKTHLFTTGNHFKFTEMNSFGHCRKIVIWINNCYIILICDMTQNLISVEFFHNYQNTKLADLSNYFLPCFSYVKFATITDKSGEICYSKF